MTTNETKETPSVRMPVTALTEDELLFRSTIREYAETRLKPLARKMDEEGVFDKSLLKEFFELGIMGVEIPEEYGGAGGSFFMAVMAVEEFSRVDPAVGVIIDVHNTLVNNVFLRWADEVQKKKYFPRLAKDWVGAYALSEATSGSDAFALSTRAEERGDHFILNGRKMWITNAKEADVFILFANANPSAGYKGITAFIVEKTFRGFSIGKKEDKLGIRASSTCELLLDDCIVPKENVLGKVGIGYKIAIETLNEGRIGIGAQMTGLGQGAYEAALAYTKERKAFGKMIADFQAVQFQLAEMAIDLECSRTLTYNTARLRDAGLPFVKEAAMTKYYSSMMAERVASMAVSLLGGYGYTKDYPVEKFYRDAKIGQIYEGTSNMQLQTIAKIVLSEK
jgi:butyryl-CoA dehydrogenase/short/branched chain acyl-CoA dehydrogenase